MGQVQVNGENLSLDHFICCRSNFCVDKNRLFNSLSRRKKYGWWIVNIFRKDLDNKPEIRVAVPVKKYMMSLNESSLNPIEALSSKLAETFSNVQLNRYVSSVTPDLKRSLAEYVGHGINESQILFGNGVDDMLYFIFTAVRNYNSSYALSLAPSYFDYKTYSGSIGLDMEFLDFNQDFNFSVDDYLEKLNYPGCELGIICNPNNPTGHLIPDKKIVHILKNTMKPILIDETYFEFSGKTFVDMVKEFPNIIITRSFSKSFSAAGLRFGYIISSEENIKFLNKVIPVFNCSILTQALALTILENREVFVDNNKKIIASKEEMFNTMKEYKEMTIYPSHTNFLTFSLGENSEEFNQFLLERDISVRPVGAHALLANHLRVTVADEESNQAFLDALSTYLKGKH